MKKYIISLFIALFAFASIASAETASLTGAYEGQYIFRGQKISDNVLSATAVVNLPSQTDFSVTAYRNANNKDADVKNEVDVTLSQGFSVDKVTTVTVGATGYFYPQANRRFQETKKSYEGFASLSYDAFLNPTITAGYDFNLKQVFVEGGIGQDVKLPFIGKNWKLAPSLTGGFVTGRDILPEASGPKVKDSYYYIGGKVDVVYEVKYFVAGVGYRANYLANSSSTTNSWLGTFVTVRF